MKDFLAFGPPLFVKLPTDVSTNPVLEVQDAIAQAFWAIVEGTSKKLEPAEFAGRAYATMYRQYRGEIR